MAVENAVHLTLQFLQTNAGGGDDCHKMRRLTSKGTDPCVELGDLGRKRLVFRLQGGVSLVDLGQSRPGPHADLHGEMALKWDWNGVEMALK